MGWNEDRKDVVFFKNLSHFIVQIGRTAVHDQVRLLERHGKIFPTPLDVRDKNQVDPSEKDMFVDVTRFGVLDNCLPRRPPFSDQALSDTHLLDDDELLCGRPIRRNAGHECCMSCSLGIGYLVLVSFE